MPVDQTRRTVDGLTVKAYRGDGAALLAFDVDEHLADDLAGFAVQCVAPSGERYPILNRLSFEQRITADTTPRQRRWTPTDVAPLQKFHWAHFPRESRRAPSPTGRRRCCFAGEARRRSSRARRPRSRSS